MGFSPHVESTSHGPTKNIHEAAQLVEVGDGVLDALGQRLLEAADHLIQCERAVNSRSRRQVGWLTFAEAEAIKPVADVSEGRQCQHDADKQGK